MSVKCAECQCAPHNCLDEIVSQRCVNCTKDVCCCTSLHQKEVPTSIKLTLMGDCCNNGICKQEPAKTEPKPKLSILQFVKNIKSLVAAALGIEILCITAAEIGENTGLYVLGFNHIGIPIAYAMGYTLASFTTFATILGRYKYGSGNKVDSCCSVLEQDDNKSFVSNLIATFRNFGSGLRKMKDLPKQPNMKGILKSTLVILITAETACIITAETVDLIFFKQAIYLSVPLALIAGAFTVVAPEAYRMMKPR